jgi:murein L,D-transpeptidase YcbB/YkuD
MPTGFSDARAAAEVLAGWWGVPERTDISQCGSHRPDQALCAQLRLNSAMLRSLDRPVVLELRGRDQSEWLALRRLDTDQAQVAGPQQLGERFWHLIEARWLGDALLVVKPPEHYDGALLAKGAEGDVVRLIHAALAIFDGTEADDVRRFDDDTAQRVRALQLHYGLGADGVVGPETLALLMALQSTGPRLSDGRDPKAFVSVPQR